MTIMTTHPIDSEETVDLSKRTEPNYFAPKLGYTGPMSVLGGRDYDDFGGGPGNDYFKDAGGGSEARGGSGYDYLEGGNGKNDLYGGDWNDTLVANQQGDSFHDRLFGGQGRDTLVAGRVDAGRRVDDGTGAMTDGTKGKGPNHGIEGNVFKGGRDEDTFVLNADSYVYITDYERVIQQEDGAWSTRDLIYVTGLRDEDIDVVHHPQGGAFNTAHFRIMLGNKVLAEINYGEAVNPWDEDAVQAAIDLIKLTITTLGGDWVYGTQGDDELSGTHFEDHLTGHRGDDRLDGGAGVDILLGGHGNDILHGGSGHDNLQGQKGNDEIHGDGGRDMISGGSGNDQIYGGSGDDQIYGGHGHDRIDGGAGRDVLYGDEGRDIFVISTTDKVPDIIMDFNVDEDFVRLPVGFAQDDVRFETGTLIYGDWGINEPVYNLVTGEGESKKVLAQFRGLDEKDLSKVEFIWDFDPRVEAERNDPVNLKGTNKKDLLFGKNGDDTIKGLGAMDVLYGRGGADTLHGGKGKDTLYGGKGDDSLFGGDNNDILDGGEGNDRLDGGSRDDRLYGRDGNDTLIGGAGDDRLEGGEGNLDVLRGGDGDDRLFGDGGNDRLEGGRGTDHLHGGEGRDEFMFRQGDGLDIITDFNVDEDIILFLAQTEEQAMDGENPGRTFLQVSDLKIRDDDEAGGVVITSNRLEGVEIILKDVTFEMLSANNFDVLMMEEYESYLSGA